MDRYYADSELIINEDGSVFHLHVKPAQIADKIILVGDPGRVTLIARHFKNRIRNTKQRISYYHRIL